VIHAIFLNLQKLHTVDVVIIVYKISIIIVSG